MRRAARQGGAAGPVRAFALLTLGLTGAVALAVQEAGWPAMVLGAGGLAVGAGVALPGLAAGYPHHRLGACNAVTLVRAAMAAALAAGLASPGAAGWPVVAVAALALVLDGVDGALARREGLVSAFGARFDMEVDAALALVLALLALEGGKAGAWVLALGGLRYAFVAAAAVLPWLRADLPSRRGRKTVCVIQIAALTALLAPPVVPPWSLVLGLVATALLALSFAVDVLWLWRRR